MCCLIHSVALVKKCIVCGAESTDINNANISFHGLVIFRIYSSNEVASYQALSKTSTWPIFLKLCDTIFLLDNNIIRPTLVQPGDGNHFCHAIGNHSSQCFYHSDRQFIPGSEQVV